MPGEKGTANTTARKRAPRKSVATAKNAVIAAHFVGPELRAALIAEAAFFRAEKRGFAPGHEVEDWLAAESEVEAALLRTVQSPAQL